MQTNFEKWIETEADMPEFVNGEWVDLETGFTYSDWSSALPRFVLSEKALAARDVAKRYGGKALIGSARQKEWAEKIRAEKLAGVSQEQAVMLCDPHGLGKHSKFWINNRFKKAEEFGAFVELQKGLLKQHKTANALKQADKVAEIAQKYNKLTTKWGFND